jgi:hypothetical protein
MSRVNLPDLFGRPRRAEEIKQAVLNILRPGQQPSAGELLLKLEEAIGWQIRFDISEVVEDLAADSDFTQSERQYLLSLLQGGSLAKALRGEDAPDRETISTIDLLLRESKLTTH